MGILKKLITFSTALIFLTLCVFPAIDAELSMTNNQSEVSERINEEITLYRVDINGRMTPVQVSITFEKGQDSNTAIAEKCKELCKTDKEMKKSIGISGDWPIEINSSGTGTHWAIRWIIFPHRKVLWRLMIRYRYFSDNSYTNVTINGIEKSWTGPQSIRINGFTGYVNFKPSILFGSTIIQGYAKGIQYGLN